MAAQNESSQRYNIICKTNESLLKIYRIKIWLYKICYMYMIPVLTCKVSTDFINDSFSLVFSRNSSSSSIINKLKQL